TCRLGFAFSGGLAGYRDDGSQEGTNDVHGLPVPSTDGLGTPGGRDRAHRSRPGRSTDADSRFRSRRQRRRPGAVDPAHRLSSRLPRRPSRFGRYARAVTREDNHPPWDVGVRLADPRRDAGSCAALYRPVVARTHSSVDDGAPNPAETASRMDQTLPTLPWLVAEDAPAVLGYAYASPHRARTAYRWSVDISVYLQED